MNADIYLKIQSMSPQFLVTDLDRSIEFYTKKLGFEIDFRYEDFYCGITKDGCSIHLKLVDATIGERENRKNNGHLDITFSVEKIDGLYEYVKSTSVEVIQPIRDMPYGREFYISDPDGYIIAFLQAN
jgi:predicted enzyme related to lactoylglutathione lyase